MGISTPFTAMVDAFTVPPVTRSALIVEANAPTVAFTVLALLITADNDALDAALFATP